MAFKVAFLAALCVAQAFAFPSFEDDEISDYDIFVDCFDQQREKLDVMGEKMAKVVPDVLDYLKGEMKEKAEKYIIPVQEPVAKINATVFELHSNVKANLRDRKLPEATETLLSGIKAVKGIFGSIREHLQQAVEEVPELSDTMEWLFRYLVFEMKDFFPFMRQSFGKCLMESENNPFN